MGNNADNFVLIPEVQGTFVLNPSPCGTNELWMSMNKIQVTINVIFGYLQ